VWCAESARAGLAVGQLSFFEFDHAAVPARVHVNYSAASIPCACAEQFSAFRKREWFEFALVCLAQNHPSASSLEMRQNCLGIFIKLDDGSVRQSLVQYNGLGLVMPS